MGNLFQQTKKIDHKYLVDKNKRVGNSANWQQTNSENYNQFQFERFDTYNGLFNTQQFIGALDFNDFSKHCFFNSAVSKVEYTFNQIYDDFPVDGTKQELNEFLNNLDGFSRYIYNQMDKNIGYLKFNDSYIEVQNKSGYLTSFNRNAQIVSKLSKPVLNPVKKSFSFDFRINIIYDPIQSLQNQVIFQYLDKTNSRKNGFTLFVKDFSVLNSESVVANVVFHMSNITNSSKLVAKFSIPVNSWQHVSICVDNINNSNSKQIKIWINSFLQNITDKIENFPNTSGMEIADSINFYLGKGDSHVITDNNGAYNLGASPNYFWGYIDEFRFLHQAIDESWVIKNKDENIYAQDTLKLYFKFNEPTGIYEKNMFCFDSSGNSLHSRIQLKPFLTNNPDVVSVIRQMISDLRYNPTDENQPKPSLKFEKDEFNPCLMPTFTKNKLLNETFITEAKDYDLFNPNLIFKLFPKHYFEEGAQFEGLSETFKSEKATTYYIFDSSSSDEDNLNYPGQQKSEGVQTFAKLLLIWAKFFDEIKIYLDVMPKLINIDYSNITTTDNAINFFLPLMAKNAGFEFKEIMNSPTSKILDGYIIGSDGIDKSEFTLRFVQNELWKRILINSRDMLQSKGTKNAIRSVFNAIGVIPEEYYRFKEKGGKNTVKFTESSFLQKTKNIKFVNFFNTNNNLKLETDLSYLSSKLSYKNNSYAIEFFINYPFVSQQQEDVNLDETLFTLFNKSSNQIILKVKFEKAKQSGLGNLKLILFKLNNTQEELIIENVDLLNNLASHICINVDNNDTLNSKITLNLQYCSKNSIVLQKDIKVKKSDYYLLHNNENKKIIIGENFNGQFSHLKIWKNLLSNEDLKMHSLDIHSISNHELALLKYNQISELLLLNLTLQDDSFYENNDVLLPIDFSENNQLPTINNQNTYAFKIYGLNNLLPADYLTFKSIVCYENDFKFDEPNVDNKVNILSFQDENLIEQTQTQKVPVYQVNYDNQKKNDMRFSIEMSNVKHLNEDIGRLFSSIEFFADILSDFGTLNESYYNKFEKFSDFYFKRIKSTSIQIAPLYDLYQIFDNVLTEMLSEFVSSRVKFNNNIYVIESHALERHKFHYKFLESHIVMKGDMTQSNINNSRKSFNYLKLEGRILQ